MELEMNLRFQRAKGRLAARIHMEAARFQNHRERHVGIVVNLKSAGGLLVIFNDDRRDGLRGKRRPKTKQADYNRA